MKLNHFNYTILTSAAVLLSSAVYANNISDTWQGPVHANLNLYAFAADLDGTISDSALNYKLDQPFKETAKNLDHSYMFLLDVSKGRWGAYADYQNVQVSESKSPMHIPVAVDSTLKQESYGLYYQAFRSADLNPQSQDQSLGLIIEPTIGVHRTTAKAKLAALGHQVQGDSKWNEFYWGSRFKYNFDSPWNLAAELTAGVENSQDIQAYVGYRQQIFKQPVNFRVGYRYFKQDYRDQNFHWDVRQQGPVIGINLPLF